MSIHISLVFSGVLLFALGNAQTDVFEVHTATKNALLDLGNTIASSEENKIANLIESARMSYPVLQSGGELTKDGFVALHRTLLSEGALKKFGRIVDIVHESQEESSDKSRENVTVTKVKVFMPNGEIQTIEKRKLKTISIANDGLTGYSSVVETALRLHRTDQITSTLDKDYITNGQPNPKFIHDSLLLSPASGQVILEPVILECFNKSTESTEWIVEDAWIWQHWKDFVLQTLRMWTEKVHQNSGISVVVEASPQSFPHVVIDTTNPSNTPICKEHATTAEPVAQSLLNKFQWVKAAQQQKDENKGIRNDFVALSLAFKTQYLSYVSKHALEDDVAMHAYENIKLCENNLEDMQSVLADDVHEHIWEEKRSYASFGQELGLVFGMLGGFAPETDPRLVRLQFLCPDVLAVTQNCAPAETQMQLGGLVGAMVDLAEDFDEQADALNEGSKSLPGSVPVKKRGRPQARKQKSNGQCPIQ